MRVTLGMRLRILRWRLRQFPCSIVGHRWELGRLAKVDIEECPRCQTVRHVDYQGRIYPEHDGHSIQRTLNGHR